MKSAGLTHGGFYGHFASKDDLMAQATERALGKLHTAWAALARDAAHNGKDPLGAVESAYLSARHRDAPGHGCLLGAVGVAGAAAVGEDVGAASTLRRGTNCSSSSASMRAKISWRENGFFMKSSAPMRLA